MVIDLRNIPEEGLDLSYKEAIERLSLDEEGYPFSTDVAVNTHIKKEVDTVFISGSLEAELKIGCSRCLKKFTFRINPHFAVDYIPSPQHKEEGELELTGSEMEVGFYKGDALELDELVKEQIILSIPMQPLCSPSCKGICPVCGQNLNIKECGCGKDSISPHFAVLKNFLKKE